MIKRPWSSRKGSTNSSPAPNSGETGAGPPRPSPGLLDYGLPLRPAAEVERQGVPASSTGLVGNLLYGDDLLLVVSGGRDQGAVELRSVELSLAQLGLSVSRHKTRVSSIHQPWSVLGLIFEVDGRGGVSLRVPSRKRRDLKRRLSRAISGLDRGGAVDDPEGPFIRSMMSSTAYYARAGADLGFLQVAERLVVAGVSRAVARKVEDHITGRRLLRSSRRDRWSTSSSG